MRPSGSVANDNRFLFVVERDHPHVPHQSEPPNLRQRGVAGAHERARGRARDKELTLGGEAPPPHEALKLARGAPRAAAMREVVVAARVVVVGGGGVVVAARGGGGGRRRRRR